MSEELFPMCPECGQQNTILNEITDFKSAYCKYCDEWFQMPSEGMLAETRRAFVEAMKKPEEEVIRERRERNIAQCGTRSTSRAYRNRMYAFTKVTETDDVGRHILIGLYIDPAYIGKTVGWS